MSGRASLTARSSAARKAFESPMAVGSAAVTDIAAAARRAAPNQRCAARCQDDSLVTLAWLVFMKHPRSLMEP